MLNMKELYYKKGCELYKKGDYSNAERFWLLASDLNDDKSIFGLGLIYYRMGYTTRAKNCFEKAANLNNSAAKEALGLLFNDVSNILYLDSNKQLKSRESQEVEELKKLEKELSVQQKRANFGRTFMNVTRIIFYWTLIFHFLSGGRRRY